MKVVLISCYKHEYVRFSVLQAALELMPNVELQIIRNTKTGVSRYPEVLRGLLATRSNKPDIYLLTFRGYEILLPLLLIAGHTPVIYDEFINPLVVTREHRMQKRGIMKFLMSGWNLLGKFYYQLARRAKLILLDTSQHAQFSATDSGIPLSQYVTIPVGADERLFKPAGKPTRKRLQVMFYGHMAPLHGLSYILEAATLLAKEPIDFIIVGGKAAGARAVELAVAKGAHVLHYGSKPIEELATMITQSDIFLGGPFGDTVQSQLVITGKTYQALACQTAVIVGSSAATTSYFIDRRNALVVPQANSNALASAISWASKHPKELQQIAAAGREVFTSQFSAAQIALRLQHSLAAAVEPEPQKQVKR